jgi:hypothetical protein
VTTIVVIVSIKLLLLCLQWPALLTRVGAGVVGLARLVPRRREELLPVARVVRR